MYVATWSQLASAPMSNHSRIVPFFSTMDCGVGYHYEQSYIYQTHEELWHGGSYKEYCKLSTYDSS